MSDRFLLDHVACGVRRLDELAPLLERELGAAPHRGGPGAGFAGRQWSFDGDGRLELIAPDGPPGGFLHRFLDSRGPGIHHVTFKVPDIHSARDRAIAHGFDVVGFYDENPAWQECFLHPKQTGGIVVQMAHADPDAQSDDWAPFASSWHGQAARRVALVGPRLVSGDRFRTHNLWIEMLGGHLETGDDDDRFTWPHSPLRIRVVYEPNPKAEGPVALEIRTASGALPEALPALLGTNLVVVED